MDVQLARIMIVGSEGKLATYIEHTHSGPMRDRGECIACDQFHDLYCDL